MLDLRQKGFNGRIVEMTPVVVGQDEHINSVKITSTVDIAPRKGFIYKKDRRRKRAKDGINQDTIALELQIKGRVPHPDSHIISTA